MKSSRYDKLKNEGRLRTKLETWNTNPDEIIRYYTMKELKDWLNSINLNKQDITLEDPKD